MSVLQHALYVLGNEKRELKEKLLDLSLLEDEGEVINEKVRTRYKHQLESLEFAMEILEDYTDWTM